MFSSRPMVVLHNYSLDLYQVDRIIELSYRCIRLVSCSLHPQYNGHELDMLSLLLIAIRGGIASIRYLTMCLPQNGVAFLEQNQY